MRWETQVAIRHLRSHHRSGFVSVVTWFSVLGISIGTAALIIVLAVMSGFESEVRGRIVGLDAHVRVRSFHDAGLIPTQSLIDTLAQCPKLKSMHPYILEKGMLRHRGMSEGVVVRGLGAGGLKEVLPESSQLLTGSLNLQSEEQGLPGVLLGRYLAASLNAMPGDTLLLLSPAGIVSAFSQPLVRRFELRGIFEMGIFEFDDAMAFIGIDECASLFRMGERVTGFDVRLIEIDDASEAKAWLLEHLSYPHSAWTWYDLHKNLFSMMKLEKWMMFLMLSLIVLVAAFNIVATLTMTTMERRREIGILKAMGANSACIARVFITEGFLLGGSGTLAGVSLGSILCWLQMHFKVLSLPPDVYFISTFPVNLRGFDILVICVSALLISLAAALYPALRAAALHPVEAIRND
jgi:lipoprotein-releasing system permease protein